MSTKSGTSWIQSASDRSPPAFFEAFDIYFKQHGHQRYAQAIRDSNLDMDIKLDLWQKFKYWKANEGVQFWLDRQSQSSQMKTASTLVKGSESYAKDSIHHTEPLMHSIISQAGHSKKRSLNTNFVEGLQMTPKRRVTPISMPRISTTSVDSPNLIPTTYSEENLFMDDVDEDDFMIPDITGDSYRFSAILDGLDIGGSFGQLFQDVKAKKVYVTDTDQALLTFSGDHFLQSVKKSLQNWKSVDVTVVRNEVRSRLDHFEDHDFDRAKCLEFLLSCAKDPKHQRLWTYFVSALQEFPSSDTARVYSESTAISSFILSICRVFVSAPDKKLFLDFVDSANHAGKASISRKEPDLGLNFKDDSNKTICNVGIAEVTSIAQKGYKKKNAKDLVRVGEMLKNALDHLQDDFGITDAVVPGWQVIAHVMSIYIMFRCGNLYLMVYVKDVTIPDSLNSLKNLGVDIKTWLELQTTITFGLQNVLKQASSGKKQVVTPGSHFLERISTVGTPEFKTFLTKK
ncbi:hypothetical protein BX616_002861 [Lobosporangium transversale]|nr:hypothetical protein BX616_002861 [Lobosporangium transversale]